MDFSLRFHSTPSALEIETFQKAVISHYHTEGRQLAWRLTVTPYRVFVSEIMLQQTQVHRVAPKFEEWMDAVPDFAALAALPTNRLLALWQGLGYNRRALNLRESAKRIETEYAGELPGDPEILRTLPGIGPATAASMCAFAFDMPVIFIETNIRRVFIHFFFNDAEGISDTELLPLVEASLWRKSPRDWYNALMDIGTELKKVVPNPNRRSRHYTKQSPFEGSLRQARGAILKALQGVELQLGAAELAQRTGIEYERISKAAEQLASEGFLASEAGKYGIHE